jgi:hypothetical protein
MDAKVQARLLSVAAYIGIALVLLSTLGKQYWLTLLAIPAFALIIAGGVGLIILQRRESLRKVSPPGSESALGAGAGIPLPQSGYTTPPVPPPMAFAQSGTLPIEPSLQREVKFDLSKEYRQYKARMRVPVLFRMGVYAFIIGLGAYSIAEGLLELHTVGIAYGAVLVLLGATLAVFIRGVGRGVDWISVGPSGIVAHLVPSPEVTLPWSSPLFGARIIETSAAVNQAKDPPKSGPTFQFFCGTGSGMGRGPRVLTAIPIDCYQLILAQAAARQLQIADRVEGPRGTVSERRVIRITAGTLGQCD